MADHQPSRKPEDNAFQQQRLKAWQPLLTPMWVIGTFAVIGIVFVPVGSVILSASRGVKEQSLRYDQLIPSHENCNFTGDLPTYQDVGTTWPSGCTTTFNFTIADEMKQPVYVYYQLTNFYQNHRRYVKSRSDEQLRGVLDGTDFTSCDPLEKSDGKVLYPCGLIANSMFNDTFAATRTSGGTTETISWKKDGIAWKSDVEDKFKSVDVNTSEWRDTFTTESPDGDGRPLPNVEDEDFIVWMRTAGLPTFKKLYRIIDDRDLKAGDTITFTVQNTFPVSTFDGQKWVVISTTSWLGGKNDFLGYAYIVVGALCLLLAVVFFIKHKMSPRPLGDMKYFNWPGARAAPPPAGNN